MIITGQDDNTLFEEHSDDLRQTFKQFWEVENVPTKGPIEAESKPEDILRDLTFSNKRYQVKLPWIDQTSLPPLADKYELCKGRLNSLLFRLNKEPNLLNDYDKIICDQLRDGIIEPIPEFEYGRTDSYFIPHHPMIRRDSGRDTTKVRIVFDGSAKSSPEDFSINDYVEDGPNVIPYIFDSLLKFRREPIGLMADIKSAFLQISIHPEDRRKLRFLWYTDLNSDKPKLKQFQFSRLMFGLKPSPPILGVVVNHHVGSHEQTYQQTVKALRNIYVDDLATSVNNEEEGFQIYKESKAIMLEGNFDLGKWNSNCKLSTYSKRRTGI